MSEYWQQERERNLGHWQAKIRNFRNQLKRLLTTNLRNYLAEELDSIYEDALGYVKDKTCGQLSALPSKIPYTLEQLLDANWLPDKKY